MKKNIKIGVLIIISLSLISLFYFANRDISYDPKKAEKIGIDESVSFLISCKNSQDPLTQYFCPRVEERDLYKLNYIKDINVNKLCAYSIDQEKPGSDCSIENYVKQPETLWTFEYSPSLGKVAYRVFTITKSQKNYLLVIEGHTKEKILYEREIFILETLDENLLKI